jgi:SAM-dependent methyltransferase
VNPAATALHFEALSKVWAACELFDQPEEAAHVLRWLEAQPRQTGLDLACGPGRFTRHLAAFGGRLLGVDICDRMLKLAAAWLVEQRVRTATLTQQDAHRLEFAAGLFDWAVCRYGMRYFGNPSQVLSELARVIHPGGRLYLSDWTEPAGCLDGLFHRLDPAHRRVIGAGQWPELIAAAGFRILRERRRPDRVDPRVWGRLGGLDEAAADAAWADFREGEGSGARVLVLDGREVLAAERGEWLLEQELPACGTPHPRR